nr:hypothetical protein [Tanacetum cinerariifolium]
MKSLSPQVVSSAKLPILNPNEFDLWKMRIEQYFLMIDYSLWEVILNGDFIAPTRVVEGVVQPVAPTTAEHRLARKNELKARGSSIESLDQIYDRLQKLISQLDILDLEEQSLDDLFNSLKIYKAKVKSSSTAGTSTKNIAFVSSNTDSTNEPVSAAASVSTVSAKIPVSALPNIDADDLEEIDLKWQMAMLIVRARQKRSLPTMPSWHSPLPFLSVLTMSDDLFTSESDDSLPASPQYDRYNSRDGYHDVPPPYTGTFMPPKPDLVFHNAPNATETDHTAFNVELSPTKPDTVLSHNHRPSAPITEDWVSDSEDDSEPEIPHNAPSFVQPTEQVKTLRPSVQYVKTSIPATTSKTALLKPQSQGKGKNRKACFVCKSLTYLIKDCDFYEKKIAQTPVRNHAKRGNHQQYARMTLPNPQRHVVPTAVLTQSKLVPITAARPVTTVVPKFNVTRPRHAKTVVTRPYSTPRRHINHNLSFKAITFPPNITAAKAPMVNVVKGNPHHALKDKGVIDSGCSRHMIGNISYLSDFEEINGGYVAFGGNPKGDFEDFSDNSINEINAADSPLPAVRQISTNIKEFGSKMRTRM